MDPLTIVCVLVIIVSISFIVGLFVAVGIRSAVRYVARMAGLDEDGGPR